MFSFAMLIQCWLLCSSLVKNWTWGKDVIFDSMDDSTDVVVAVEEFANTNKDDAASALGGFVDKENEDWDLFFWSKSPLCVLFVESFVWNEDEEKMNVSPLCLL